MCIYNEILNTYTKSDDRCAENSIYKSSTKVLPYSFFPEAAMLTSIYIILQYSLCSSSALICQEGFSFLLKVKTAIVEGYLQCKISFSNSKQNLDTYLLL